MAITPLAINTFDFKTLIISRYVSGAWTDPEIFASAGGGELDSVSAGSVTAGLTGRRGAISFAPLVVTPDAQMIFLGEGLPATTYKITSSDCTPGAATQPVLDTYFDCTIGAWYYNSRWWIFCNVIDGPVSWAVFSTDDPSIAGSWKWEDIDNTPPKVAGPSGAQQGGCIQYDPVNNILYLFALTGGSYDYGVYDFNFNTRVWTGPYASLTLPSFSNLAGQHFGACNGIVHFANGDFGIFYALVITGTIVLYYRLYDSLGATWGSPVNINPSPVDTNINVFGNMLVDLVNPDLLYVFYCESGYVGLDFSKYCHPHCVTVTHAGTVTNVFDFPLVDNTGGDSVEGSDGFGQGMILDSKIFIPLDYFSDFANAVWIAPVSNPTSFVKTILPVRPENVGETPSCAYMSFEDFTPPPAGGGGYVFMRGGAGGAKGNYVGT